MLPKRVRDRLLGMMAVEKGLIAEKDLTKCLNIAEFSEDKSMKEVMVEQGVLTQYKADKLERILERQSNPESARLPPVPTDKQFGVLAVENDCCDQGSVDAALGEQSEFAGFGINIPIGQILMSHGAISPNDVATIIERQGRRRLECKTDGKAFNVTGYDEDKFYTCPKCEGDLMPCEIDAIPREKLESKLNSMRAKKKKEEEAKRKAEEKKSHDPFDLDIDIDFDALDDDDSDDEPEEMDDSDDDLGDLMILEL